jgi:hypothetical protein
MSFWSRLWSTGAGTKPNANGPSTPPTVGGADYTGGDPNGVIFDTSGETTTRSLPFPLPSGWDGWPASWNVPAWDFGSKFNELVDIAWACLDLNSRVLSTMPVYRTRQGEVIPPATWMTNPDSSIYSSWHEFAKQLFWDWQLGEAFVLPVARGFDGYPLTFRVVPPWMVHVEMKGGVRVYHLGGLSGPDITDEVLHIRYKSTTDGARGVGALEAAGGRMLTAGILAKYVREVATTGGVPYYTLETDQVLEDGDAQDLLEAWVTNRAANPGAPPVLDSNLKLVTHMAMSPKDMAMMEVSEFTEGRIAILLGVPPFIMGLSTGNSMVYSNVSQVFEFHDRSFLHTAAAAVMADLSWWALPALQCVELNRDEYTRPSFEVRAQAYVQLVGAGIMSVEEVRMAERLTGHAPAAAITGGTPAPYDESVST